MIVELLMMLFLGGAAAAVICLAVLTVSAVVEQARAWWGARTRLVVIDPAASPELARIAAERGSRPHKRFVYNRDRSETRLVESESISGEIAYRSEVELYVA
jgi:hypothetical protein